MSATDKPDAAEVQRLHDAVDAKLDAEGSTGWRWRDLPSGAAARKAEIESAKTWDELEATGATFDEQEALGVTWGDDEAAGEVWGDADDAEPEVKP